MKARLLLVVAAMAVIAGCSKKDEPVAAVPATPVAAPVAAPVTAPVPAPAPAGASQMPTQGKILQLLQAAGYTYAEVDLGGGQKVWMAGGPLNAKVGDVVQWNKAAVMQNFTAKSLGRTFDTILFVGSWGKEGAPAAKVAPHGQNMAGMRPPIDPAMMAPPADKPLQASGNNSGQIKSVIQSGDYTYLEITQGKSSVWIAGPKNELKAGDKVVWEGDMVMTNFESKSLNRRFEKLIFASRVSLAK